MNYLAKLKNLGIIIYKIENNELFILLHSVKDSEKWNYFYG